MKNRIFAFLAASVLLLTMSGLSVAVIPDNTPKARQTASLVALLPASDGIATLDARRLFDTAIPTILSSNQPMLDGIRAKLGEIENKTGIDLRKFDQVVVGVSAKKVSAKDFDFDPVAIARGDISAGALVAVAKLASNGTYREEKVGEHTIYVFSARDIGKKAAAKSATAVPDFVDKALDGLTHEVAVTSLDSKTLVFGSLSRVTQTLEGKSKVGTDVSALLPTSESAVVAFAFRSPGGLSGLLPLENDDLGKSVEAIKYVAGSLDVTAAGTGLKVMARTAKAEQAQDLLDTLEGLQLLGKAFLGSSKRPDQQVYGRMLKNAKLARNGNDLTLDLLVPQSDIDVVIAKVK